MKKIVSFIGVAAVLIAFTLSCGTSGPAYSLGGFSPTEEDGTTRSTADRSAVSRRAMVSSSKYEVSQVGAEILRRGGNAIDAAVAMGFAIGVVEPFSNGVGGGGFATVRTAAGETYFVDFREIAPINSHPRMYMDAAGNRIQDTNVLGGRAVGIPGDVAGLLYMLENYGTMTRAQVMAPAIRMATQGFELTAFAYRSIMDGYGRMTRFSDPSALSVYFDEDGLPHEVGTIITNPDLGRTLQMISDGGVNAFYTGEIAQAMVDAVNGAVINGIGGIFTYDELANYRPSIRTPVSGTYRGVEIISSPPPSSGGAILLMILNMLEHFDVASMQVNSPEYINMWAEIFKLAYADRGVYMADTDFQDVPVNAIASKEYAASRVQRINLGRAAPSPVAPADPWAYEDRSTNTTHFSIADSAGNMVGVTKTINFYWGAGVFVEGYGFFMNNEMDDFVTNNANHMNAPEPNKKPLSSMSPTLLLKDGKPFMVLGTPGGTRIFANVAQVISLVVDHGFDLEKAIGMPKIHNTSANDAITYEVPNWRGFEDYLVTEETLAALVAMGHNRPTTFTGGAVQAVQYLDDGTLFGTADPRQDGRAVGR
ncbi:MAG: gamma-glutamyltransferase [Treponema sp.]|nr:gamma-glutamyltransferase [Treponema sp.]